jgi:hypothetical protein
MLNPCDLEDVLDFGRKNGSDALEPDVVFGHKLVAARRLPAMVQAFKPSCGCLCRDIQLRH